MSWSDARAAPSTRRPAQSRIRPRPPAPVGWPGPAGHLKRLPRGVASRQSERNMVARNAGILLNRSPGPERAAIRSCPSPIPHRFRPNCCRWGRSRSTRGCAWPLHDASRPRQRGPSRVHRGLSPDPAAGTGAERNCRAACPDPAAWPRAAIRPGQGERLRRTLGAAPGTTPDIACKHTDLTVFEIRRTATSKGRSAPKAWRWGRAGSPPGSAGSAVMSDGRQLAQPPCARPPGGNRPADRRIDGTARALALLLRR